jgi:hypothetical protein
VLAALADQSQVGLVDQGRRLQRVAGTLASEIAAGDLVEFGVDEREQLVERSLIPMCPLVKEQRHVPSGRLGHGGRIVAWLAPRRCALTH